MGYKTGEKEFLVSHGIDMETDRNIILQCEHPRYYQQHCKAYYDHTMMEWIMPS
jgi:hypothetical protein